MTLAAEQPVEGALRAHFNYVVDPGRTLVRYIDWPEMEAHAVLPEFRQHEMSVHDGRPLRHSFDLDTHGFCFVDHRTAVDDFNSEAQRQRIYDAEVKALVMRHSGACDVVVFDHTVRIGDASAQRAMQARPPVKSVHNDYTERSAPKRLAEIVGEAEAQRRMRRRWAIVQVWRPIRGDVMTDPLGICDGRSIPRRGFVLLERRYKYRTGEVYQISHDPSHRWYWFPRMTRNEALVFKVYDSDETRLTRFTAHSAFDDPTATPDAPARESIETRTFAFFD